MKEACKGGRGAGVSVLFPRYRAALSIGGAGTLPTPANRASNVFTFSPASEPSRHGGARNAVGTRWTCSVTSTSTSTSARPVHRRLPKPRARRSTANVSTPAIHRLHFFPKTAVEPATTTCRYETNTGAGHKIRVQHGTLTVMAAIVWRRWGGVWVRKDEEGRPEGGTLSHYIPLSVSSVVPAACHPYPGCRAV